ncbi:hypothetical protein OIU85_010912, partial [Salix viminalis]
MVSSREGIHGKMESMVPAAPSHLGRTSLLCSRMDGGQWSPASRSSYNLRDTVSRCTVQ